MIVTTAMKTALKYKERAQQIANELGCCYIDRRDRSMQTLYTAYGTDVLIVSDKLFYYNTESQEPFFFHPNSAMYRIKRLMNGETDPFIEASSLTSGQSVLDCTLGLGSDSIVASYVVGEQGHVTAIEGNPMIAYLVKQGLPSFEVAHPGIKKAMERVDVIHRDSRDLLKEYPDDCFDVVYFDPMFEQSNLESDGISVLKSMAIHDTLNIETIEQAKRVAKRKVVLKDHWKSNRFDQFGFTVIKRKSASYHFGYIMID
ncbi:class I SAM-dependent methyltransferase [Alkalihalobacterium bogoriense]|uniref:class I SAM-dependent methyltransferase n=1 Tax=Alkalihalobacterium bogoriense TaxID=246272 RepID=UPI000478D228|nr:class I SAM-dependent methyltransferase [Alkalihalobacterium bogoriense]